MLIQKSISLSFPSVGPFEGVSAIESKLLAYGYLVVIDDDNEFYGILSPNDLIKRPHKIVIDCLTKKDYISFDEKTSEVIEKFNRNYCSALPVKLNNRFIGVVEKKQFLLCLGKKINELYEKSLISDRTKQFFLNNISHEIRTPLNGIIGFLDILTHNNTWELDNTNDSFLDLVTKSSRRFLLIMNDLIELSLLHAGDNVVIDNLDFNLDDVFFDLADFFDNLMRLQNKDITINCSLQDSSVKIYSDRKKVKHILFHLIDNAIKFSSDSIVTIGYNHSDFDGFIELFVSNKFEGDFDYKWMEVFNKTDDVGNELNPGLGIGLPLVQKLTQIIGGTLLINCHNQVICFRVKIPVSSSRYKDEFTSSKCLKD